MFRNAHPTITNTTNMQHTPIANVDHPRIALALPRLRFANRSDEPQNESVDTGPNITNSNILIMPYDIPVS